MMVSPRSLLHVLLLLLPLSNLCSMRATAPGSYDFGLNLPPMNGTTATGVFLPGIYDFGYHPAQLARMQRLGFTAVRLGINVPTAHDPTALANMQRIIEAIGGNAVIVMFGTGALKTHGTGRVDNMSAAIAAWSSAHRTFGALAGVKYELLNEPHGYTPNCNSPPCGTEGGYLRDMRKLIAGARLPVERCIVDALGYAQDPHGLVKLGWEGLIAFHFVSAITPCLVYYHLALRVRLTRRALLSAVSLVASSPGRRERDPRRLRRAFPTTREGAQ